MNNIPFFKYSEYIELYKQSLNSGIDPLDGMNEEDAVQYCKIRNDYIMYKELMKLDKELYEHLKAV